MNGPTKTPPATGKFEKFRPLLEYARDDWPQLDDEDENISGGGLVAWVAEWRAKVKEALR